MKTGCWLLAGSGVHASGMDPRLQAALIVICGAAVIFGALQMLFARRKIFVHGGETITLRRFMQAHPDGLNEQETAALLLPVAVQLGKMHRAGKMHRELTPDAIQVYGDGAILHAPTGQEANRRSGSFAAPEISDGVLNDPRSDVYSFFALMQYVRTGLAPDPSRFRSETSADADGGDSVKKTGLDHAIQKGMSPDMKSRYTSMEEVAVLLRQYRAGANVNPVKKNSSWTPKHRRIALVACSLALALGLFSVIYHSAYKKAVQEAQIGSVEAADRHLFCKPLTKLHDKDLLTYIEAGKLAARGEYERAKAQYDYLDDYMQAEKLALECGYLQAEKCLQKNDLFGAVSLYSELKEENYKDSEEKWFRTARRYAEELAQNPDTYVKAYNWFGQLSSAGDESAVAQMEELRGSIYQQGQESYRTGDLETAKKNMTCVRPYEDSEKYLLLVQIHETTKYDNKDFPRASVADLKAMFEFEDASSLLLRDTKFAHQFLMGRWETEDGSHYFDMDEKESINYNLPWIEFGDYYFVKDGEFRLYPDGNADDSKLLFDMTAVTPDCIEVFCAKDESTYTLYRK